MGTIEGNLHGPVTWVGQTPGETAINPVVGKLRNQVQ